MAAERANPVFQDNSAITIVMTVVKVSLVRSFALLYEVAVKVTWIQHMDLVGVNGESKGCHL